MDKDNVLTMLDKCKIGEDIEEMAEIEIEIPDIEFNDDVSKDANSDYKFLRKNMIETLCTANGILKHAVKNMKLNIEPRTIEATSTLIATINKTASGLFTLHSDMKNYQPKKSETTTDKKDTIKASMNDILDELDMEEAEK